MGGHCAQHQRFLVVCIPHVSLKLPVFKVSVLGMDSVAELNALGSEVQILPSPCIGCMSLRDLASRHVLTAE